MHKTLYLLNKLESSLIKDIYKIILDLLIKWSNIKIDCLLEFKRVKKSSLPNIKYNINFFKHISHETYAKLNLDFDFETYDTEEIFKVWNKILNKIFYKLVSYEYVNETYWCIKKVSNLHW